MNTRVGWVSVWLAVMVASAHAQDTTGAGAIAGVVRDATGQPTSDAAVCVQETGQCAVTDEAGVFRLAEVRAGRFVLEVAAPGLPPVATDPVVVRAGLSSTVEVSLPAIDGLQQTVTVTAPAFVPPEEIKNSAFLVRPIEIVSSAGALQDVSRYVQTLPGAVIGTNDFRNDLIVRGGSPLENLFVVDNIEVPNINTFANFASAGGTVSILDAALIQDVTFLTGGYPAPYINRASSVLQITQREGDRDRIGGRATVGFAGAGGIAEGPIGSDGRGSWIVSLRRSFLDLVTDDLGFGGVPVLYTANAKAVYDVSPSDRVWVVNISGVDRIRLGLTDDSDLSDEVSSFDIRYAGRRAATGVNWQRIFGTRGVGLLGVTQSYASVGSTVRDLVRDGIPPPGLPVDAIIGQSPLVFREDSSETETTVKYDLTWHMASLKLQAGGSVKRFGVRYDTAAPFGSDSPFAQEPGRDVFDIALAFPAYQTGAYGQVTQQVGTRVNVTAGGRVDRYDYIDATRLSPRVAVSAQLTERLSWRASYGQYAQQPLFLFLAAFDENRTLTPFDATHYVTGLSYVGGPSWRATVEVYEKRYRRYPVAAAYPSLSLANVGDTFNVREILFPLVSEGRGEARGVELFAEKKLSDRLYGQANLSLSRAAHAGRDGVLRPGSFDYPVVANVIGGWQWTPAWAVSVRFAYLSGRPYTPFDEERSIAQRRGIFDLDRVNGIRAPAYARLDLRVDRTFRVNGRTVTVFGGVQNATNRENFGNLTWNRRRNEAEVNRQIGLFPILGLDWVF
jgi:hypothetical protein